MFMTEARMSVFYFVQFTQCNSDKWLDLVNHVQVFKVALFVCNNHKSADIY